MSKKFRQLAAKQAPALTLWESPAIADACKEVGRLLSGRSSVQCTRARILFGFLVAGPGRGWWKSPEHFADALKTDNRFKRMVGAADWAAIIALALQIIAEIQKNKQKAKARRK